MNVSNLPSYSIYLKGHTVAQYTATEITDMFDPSVAPAWDRVNVDDQQKIVSYWTTLRQAAEKAVELTDDNNPESRELINTLKEAALKSFDDVVDENLNEPETPGEV